MYTKNVSNFVNIFQLDLSEIRHGHGFLVKLILLHCPLAKHIPQISQTKKASTLLSSALGQRPNKKVQRANASDLYPQALNLEKLKLIMGFNNHQFAMGIQPNTMAS